MCSGQQDAEIAFVYITYASATNPGLFLDDITIITSVRSMEPTSFLMMRRQRAPPAGTFTVSTAAPEWASLLFTNAYFAEFRTYRGSDKYTQTESLHFLQ
jgi:hypothetical protein